MATSDHIKALLKSFIRRDDSAFLTAAHYLIAEEREKGHNLLAKNLEGILANGYGGSAIRKIPNDVPIDKERGLPLLQIESSEIGWERIVLNSELEKLLNSVVNEFRKREVFKSFGTKAKQKILFFGPPGCGKTLTSRVLAGVLGLPLVYIRFDSVVSSYLGETAANLRKIFDYIQRGNWVVLFDEFDAIGKSRNNTFEHGELKRVVNSLLQLMDGFTGDSLLIAATNYESLLDYALWRRFDEICYFPYPNFNERVRIVEYFLSGFRHKNIDIKKFTKRLNKMSGGDIERVCLEAIKNSIMTAKEGIEMDDLVLGLSRQRKRMSFSIPRQNKDERGGRENGEKS